MERARKRALQKACATRKTYALDTAWWRENYCVKLAKTTSYIQYRLIQQSPRVPPLPSCVAVSAKQSTIIIHTSVRAEDCSRSSAGARKRQRTRLMSEANVAYRSRDNLPHAITVCVRQPRSERPERMKRARKRAGARKRQRALRSKSLAKQRQLATLNIDLFNKAGVCPFSRFARAVRVSIKVSFCYTARVLIYHRWRGENDCRCSS